MIVKNFNKVQPLSIVNDLFGLTQDNNDIKELVTIWVIKTTG